MRPQEISQWSKRSLVGSVMASFTGLIFFYTFLGSNEYLSYTKSSLLYLASEPHNTTVDLSYLARYNISPTFTYARRSIITNKYQGERPDLTNFNMTLFPNAKLIQRSNLLTWEVSNVPALTLQVPSSPEVDTSIMSFGAATSIDRLNASIPQLSHWLSNTTCPLHVVSPPHDSTEDVETIIQEESININLTVTTSRLPFAKAYFSAVKLLYDRRTPSTQWLVLIDDDTFIPSLPYLVSHLTKTYDSSIPQLIAAMSDDLDQIRSFGLIPFGGGGIFMSLPLAAILASPEVYDECMENPKDQGDQIFNDCLNKHTSVKPIFDHGLNQMDIMGEGPQVPDGYFESGRRMLTVHHWKSWFHVNVPMAAKVGKASGDEGIFMRWQFEDVVLNNGYSVVEYEAEVDLGKVEMTWRGEMGRWLHHIAPLRETVGEDAKKSFRLVDSELLDGMGVRQIYLHTANGSEDGINGVLELLWLV